jgi:hypothetical protein
MSIEKNIAADSRKPNGQFIFKGVGTDALTQAGELSGSVVRSAELFCLAKRLSPFALLYRVLSAGKLHWWAWSRSETVLTTSV